MINLKSVAAGIAVAGSWALAPVGSGVANADAPPVPPQVTSAYSPGQDDSQTPGAPAPSPYAVYGGTTLCGMPGMYFVNLCV